MTSGDDRTRITFDPRPGITFGQYRIVDRLGSGGMGDVFLAEDTTLHRMVALKFLPPAAALDAELRDRFLREARAAAGLNHPNIVHVYEVGEHENRPFIAMEHVDGETLRTAIGDAPIDMDRAISIGLQLAEALAEAHQAGVVHRDIKPGNVVFDRAGRPKILDFGLAAISGAEPITRDGSTLGTVGYMAPETIRGAAADRRSDLFSLGVLLYEMLSGQSPFRKQTEASTLDAVLHRDAEPLSRFRASVPPGLQAILDKVLLKDPSLRYQTADDLAADLRRERRDSELSSASMSRRDVVPPPSRGRGRWIAAAVAVVVLSGVLLLRPWKDGVSPSGVATAEGSDRRLLILPFENVPDAADAARLGEIISSLLITDLSQSPALSVVSSQHMHRILEQLEGQADRNEQAARRARADRVLVGRVLREAPLVVTAELVDTGSMTVIGSHKVQGEPDEDVFSVVDRLIPDIRRGLLTEDGLSGSEESVTRFTTQNPEAYREYVLGREAYDKFYREEALKHLERAVELDPTFANAWLALAITRYDRESLERTREAMDQALALVDRASWKDRLLILAFDAEIRGELQESERYMLQILERDPEDAQVLMELGLTQRFGMDDADRARETFERLVGLYPDHGSGWNQLAYIYSEQGGFEQALDAINRYVELAPDEANPFDSRGDIYAHHGHVDEAIDSYQQALRIRPDFTDRTRIKIALLRHIQGDPAAEAELTALAEEGARLSLSGTASARFLVAVLPLMKGKYQETLRRLDDYEVWISDRDTQVRYKNMPIWVRVELLTYLGRPEEALVEVERVATRTRQNGNRIDWVLDLKVHALLAGGEIDLAQAVLDTLESLPRDAARLNYLEWTRGRLAEARGETIAALGHFDRGRSRVWDDWEAFMVGAARVRMGRPQGALKTLEPLSDRLDTDRFLGPHGMRVHYELGKAYQALDRYDDARVQYQTFLEWWKDCDPNLPEYADAVERLRRLEAGS